MSCPALIAAKTLLNMYCSGKEQKYNAPETVRQTWTDSTTKVRIHANISLLRLTTTMLMRNFVVMLPLFQLKNMGQGKETETVSNHGSKQYRNMPAK